MSSLIWWLPSFDFQVLTSDHLWTPMFHCLLNISTWSSNMYLKHNTSKYKFLITPKHTSLSVVLISININIFQVISTKNLKGPWKLHPKRFSLFYSFPIGKGNVKIYPAQIFLPFLLTAILLILTMIFVSGLLQYIPNSLFVYSLLIFHPHPLSLLFALTFKMYIRSCHSYFLKISRILLIQRKI